MSDAIVIFIMLTTSLSLIIFGIYVRRGGYKRFYVTSYRLPVVAPQALKNVFIPLGIAFLLLSLSLTDLLPNAETRRMFWGYFVFPLFLISIILGIWSPRWLKPRWLVYLEDTYGYDFTQIVLLPEAGEEPGWAQRMRTLEDVKLWAAEVAKQHGFPPET